MRIRTVLFVSMLAVTTVACVDQAADDEIAAEEAAIDDVDVDPAATGVSLEVGGRCYVSGCSGQVCSSQRHVITTCEWRPEYACYQTAACEVQASGSCGWTQTAELQACLSGAI